MHEVKKNPEFSMHKNQIFTALEACRIFLKDNKTDSKNDDDNNGVIYQVETGEGKSCIICLIASLLALMKKTVHIASSNIVLANRDYHESFEFFQQIGLKSAVLLHENELPVNLRKSSKEKDQQNKEQDQQQNKNQTNNQEQAKNQDLDDIDTKNKGENQTDKEEKDEDENDDENDKDKTNTDGFNYNKDFYPREFYHHRLFKNSSNMNFSVCGVPNENETCRNKANIVFSTFVNFESLYLRLMETSPGYCNEFFEDCSLIIDEADSILIDELTNGTILSRSMKTNGSEVLKYIYERYQSGEKDPQKIVSEVKQRYPKCKDLKIGDIKDTFSQIDLVNNPEFQNGKKYSIETVEIKEKMTLKKIIEESKKVIDTAKEVIKEAPKTILNKKKKKRKSDKDDQDIESSYAEEVYETKKKKKKEKDEKQKNRKSKDEKKVMIFKKMFHRKVETFKQIVPFDYDHKGVLEPNKEFSGFVQQFIAIKEMMNNKENDNMIIKDVSMNYLYVSHPIFVGLYGGVCGLIGTIGNFYDKKLFKEQYSLTTKKIPRNKPNLRIEYPVILCDDINERNHKIAYEVIEFNKKENPVLVIFQDLNEISTLFRLLTSNGIKNINIFDGKDDKIKPDRIAGIKGAVSLGTNVCGRGTDIKNPVKPLHVIITYFTSNARVMNQAFGRTARQGQEGSVRIICLKDEFISPIGIINKLEVDSVLGDFRFKTKLQKEFINKFKQKRPWIFGGGIENQTITAEQIQFMRKTNININRLVCFNYEFPICLTFQTFLLIQAQKIFSLYNCPNCKYTWILFQKYVREMILESWSLFIEKAEKSYFQEKIETKYEDYIQHEYENLINWLLFYLPEPQNESDLAIVPTFMHIFRFVKNMYENKILSIFKPEVRNWLPKFKSDKKDDVDKNEKKDKKTKKDKISKKDIKFDSDDEDDIQQKKHTFISFTLGFKPYSLIDESGARIDTLEDQKDDDDKDDGKLEQTFIQDPELKYIRTYPHSCFSILSITEKIDDIYNMICKKINETIGSKIGLKFFLRRTLGGCEFGICYDFNFETEGENIKNDLNCLVDKDPLFLFTITVKSMIPILAGILIIGLVYIASLTKTITEWIIAFPEKSVKELIKKTVKEVAKLVVNDQVDKFCDYVIKFLRKKVDEQIEKIKKYFPQKARVFIFLLTLTDPVDFSNAGDKIGNFLGDKIKFKSKFDENLVGGLPFAKFLKMGFLLMLCFASFMMNFKTGKEAIKFDTKKEAADFDKNQNSKNAYDNNENQVKADPKESINGGKCDVKFKDDVKDKK